MTDFLKNIPKRPAPYTTPPGYFKDLAFKVSQQIDAKENPRNRKHKKLRLHPRYLLIRNSVVAGIAAACLGFGWFISAETNRLTQSSGQPIGSHITAQAGSTSGDAADEMYDYLMMNEDKLYDYIEDANY
ncbi:MAG: hypothetical protein ACI4BI_04840 [Anaerotardibacter sp.]